MSTEDESKKKEMTKQDPTQESEQGRLWRLELTVEQSSNIDKLLCTPGVLSIIWKRGGTPERVTLLLRYNPRKLTESQIRDCLGLKE